MNNLYCEVCPRTTPVCQVFYLPQHQDGLRFLSERHLALNVIWFWTYASTQPEYRVSKAITFQWFDWCAVAVLFAEDDGQIFSLRWHQAWWETDVSTWKHSRWAFLSPLRTTGRTIKPKLQSTGIKICKRLCLVCWAHICLEALNIWNYPPPLLAIRPATENWVESLEAPLPLVFHCSSFSCKIFIRSARDIFASTSAPDFWRQTEKKQISLLALQKQWISVKVDGDQGLSG